MHSCRPLLLALIAPLVAFAQPAPPPEPPPVAVTLRTVGLGAELPEVLLRSSAQSAPLRLRVQPHIVGEPVRYRGPARLSFQAAALPAEALEAEADSETGPPSRAAVPSRAAPQGELLTIGEVTLDPAFPRVLLCWARADAGSYHILAVPDDPENAPPGQVRFFNLTGTPVAIQTHEGESLRLEPRQSGLIPAGAREAIHFRAAMLPAGREPIMLSTVVETRPRLRRTAFLLHTASGALGGSPGSPVFTFFTLTHPDDSEQDRALPGAP